MTYHTRLKKGFTLMELLIVIAIIGILSTIVLVSVSQARIKARNTAKNSLVRQYINAAELYFSHNGRYPYGDGPDFIQYCLGVGNVGGSCFVEQETSSPEWGGESSSLNSQFNTFLSGPPASTTIVPGDSAANHYGRGIAYFACSDNTSACTAYQISWLLEGSNQNCGPANSRIASDPGHGNNTRCYYSSN